VRAGGTTFLLSAACAPAERRLTSWAPAECGVPIAPPGPSAAGRQDQEPGWGGGGAAGGCVVRLRPCAGARCARAGCLAAEMGGGRGNGDWKLGARVTTSYICVG